MGAATVIYVIFFLAVTMHGHLLRVVKICKCLKFMQVITVDHSGGSPEASKPVLSDDSDDILIPVPKRSAASRLITSLKVDLMMHCLSIPIEGGT